MVLRFLVFIAAAALCAAGDTWSKVKDVKSGSELRIYKKGINQAIEAKMDEANDERIVVVIKNEQKAIVKDEIDRIDARPAQTGSRVKKETVMKSGRDPEPSEAGRTTPLRPGPRQTVATSIGISSKPDFETVYRREAK